MSHKTSSQLPSNEVFLSNRLVECKDNDARDSVCPVCHSEYTELHWAVKVTGNSQYSHVMSFDCLYTHLTYLGMPYNSCPIYYIALFQPLKPPIEPEISEVIKCQEGSLKETASRVVRDELLRQAHEPEIAHRQCVQEPASLPASLPRG